MSKNAKEIEEKIEKDDTEQEEEKSKKRYWLYLLIFTVLLFFATFGMTYSIYKGDNPDDNEIETGQIIFSYSDVSDMGNGIQIKDAVPIKDSIGKVMVGRRQYFDFYVTATTKSSKVAYKLLVKKDGKSTLDDSNVKLYLTQLSGGFETELTLKKVSDLKTTTINNQNYYVLYEKTLNEKLENYSDPFRLRMWIDENAKDFADQIYSIKIDVQAVQVEE